MLDKTSRKVFATGFEKAIYKSIVLCSRWAYGNNIECMMLKRTLVIHSSFHNNAASLRHMLE